MKSYGGSIKHKRIDWKDAGYSWGNSKSPIFTPLCGARGLAPPTQPILLFFKFIFIIFFIFRATPAAYGGFQARGLIKAVAASLHHSHSNTRSKSHLQPTHSSQPCRILNPLSEARDRIHNLVVSSWIPFRCTTMGTSFSSCLIPLPGFIVWTQRFSNFSLHKDHPEDWQKRQNSHVPKDSYSLDLGWVPGICLFKKHCRHFCCSHPRTTFEKPWYALIFSLAPLEGCMSLCLRIIGFISPFGWFTCVIAWLMPLLTQPDSQDSPLLSLQEEGRRLEKSRAASESVHQWNCSSRITWIAHETSFKWA